MTPIPLAIDGANPLGYLAALGVVQVLAELRDDTGARLRWDYARRPVLLAPSVDDSERLVRLLSDLTRRPQPPDEAVADEKNKRSEFEAARREERRKREEIKKRKLPRDKRKAAIDAEVVPMAQRADELRGSWRMARAKAAPDLTVSLGLDLNAKSAEFAEHSVDALDAAPSAGRRWSDFCSCFGVEAEDERMAATPFALISGSGHQHFLGTAGDLMVACTADHFRSALFGTWFATDEGSSFRWDPADDRRYALLADDPTASGNKPRTIWGANRLAFEALRLFPCLRSRRQRATVGWRTVDEEEVWRWPLWSGSLGIRVIASILASGDLWRDDPESRQRLRTRGVFAVYQTRRLTVGRAPNQKFNLSPAVPVWASTPDMRARDD